MNKEEIFNNIKGYIKRIDLAAFQKLVPWQTYIGKARTVAADCGGRHDAPQFEWVPEDLQKKRGLWIVKKNGYPVAGTLLDSEWREGTTSPAVPLVMGLFGPVAGISAILSAMSLTTPANLLLVAYFTFFFFIFGAVRTLAFAAVAFLASSMTMAAQFPILGTVVALIQQVPKLNWIIASIPAFIPALYWYATTRKHARLLAEQGTDNATASRMGKAKINESLFLQAITARNERSSLIDLGAARGTLSSYGDPLAPDMGTPFRMSINDLGLHAAVMGKPGTGKSTLLRTIIKDITGAKSEHKIGLLVLDGKAQLADDCRGRLDEVVHPFTCLNFNYFDGVTPEVLARTLENIFAPPNQQSGSGKFFNSKARSVIYYARVIFDERVKIGNSSNSPMAFLRLVRSFSTPAEQDGSHEILDILRESAEAGQSGNILNDALEAFMELQSLDKETLSNIRATVESWTSPFIQSQALRPWANSEKSDFEFLGILQGLRIGFNLPENEFGIAGVAITALMKARLYTAISARDDNGWKNRVFLIGDEFQRLVDEADENMIPVARSKGLGIIIAFQNIDSIFVRLQENGANKLLESVSSFISYASSPATYKFIQNRIGKANVLLKSSGMNVVDYAATASVKMSSPYFDLDNRFRFFMKRNGVNGLLRKFFKSDKGYNRPTPKIDQVADCRYVLSEHAEFILADRELQQLNEPFVAIASVNRAGVPTRDFVKTNPTDSNFKPIKTDVMGKLLEVLGKEIDKQVVAEIQAELSKDREPVYSLDD